MSAHNYASGFSKLQENYHIKLKIASIWTRQLTGLVKRRNKTFESTRNNKERRDRDPKLPPLKQNENSSNYVCQIKARRKKYFLV